MKAFLLVLLAGAIAAGCSTTGTVGAVKRPPKWCMYGPGSLPAVKAGDDLVPKYAELKRYASRRNSRLRCLQRYTRAVSQ